MAEASLAGGAETAQVGAARNSIPQTTHGGHSSVCCAPARPAAAAGDAGIPYAVLVGDSMAAPAAVSFPGGATTVGADRPELPLDGEGPTRRVKIAPFALEPVTVTNTRFATFVRETGYVSEAERFGWSFVFLGLLRDPSITSGWSAGATWWRRVDGACWHAPEGPGSSVTERADHPVVQVSWNDAKEFAAWAGGRLPYESEWETAARADDRNARFPWGDLEPDEETILCNIWQGRFPDANSCADGYFGTAPVNAFQPNAAGLYNLAGNVWEWCADAFRVRSMGAPARARNDQARRRQEKLLKGGSFLCHISYCYRYRIVARNGLPSDSASSNTGFRVAYDK